jgi:TPR repeat protein
LQLEAWKVARRPVASMEPAWAHARAVFFGLGVLDQDISRGLRLSRASQHPDAVWLVSVFHEGAPASPAVARALLLRQGNNDPLAQCFAALLADPVDHAGLLSAAKRGNALAMAVLAKESDLGTAERFLWASRAAEANEPRGLCELGTCYWFGWECVQSKERALRLYKEAAQMGDCDGTLFYATDGFAEEEPERYVHLGRAAAQGSEHAALLLVEETPRRFEDLLRGRV